MQTALAALPKFKTVGLHRQPAPKIGQWNILAEFILVELDAFLECLSRGDLGTLLRSPCTDAACQRPREKVLLGELVRCFFDAARDRDLAFEVGPEEVEFCRGIVIEFAAFAAP